MSLYSFFNRKLFPVYRKSVSKVHELRYIFFELTHRCNLSCLHCGSDCIKDTRTPDLKSEDILRVLSEIKTSHDPSKVMVALSGGEPLCYPDLWHLGKEIRRLGFSWGMVTNGFNWNEDTYAKAIEAGMGSVTISVDGFEEDHNWLRGHPQSFERAMRALDDLVKNDFPGAFDVVTCANARSLPKLEEFHDFLVDRGLKMWRLFIISPIGRARKFPELILSGEQLRTLLKKIETLRDSSPMRVTYSESGYLGVEFEQKVRHDRFLCLAGINVSGVMVNGDILACPNIDRRFKQGNIHKDSFLDVWENRYDQFRNRQWMKVGECEHCEQWPLCQGNSFHLWDLDKCSTRYCHHKLLYDPDNQN